MMNSRTVVGSLSSADLRSATWDLVQRSHGLDAALLVHLWEIEERKLYLDWSFPSMFAYCVEELDFSEDVACNRSTSPAPHGACRPSWRRSVQERCTWPRCACFATGRKARQRPTEEAEPSSSRHIPDAIKREVFERDGGRCTFTDEGGRRCGETGALEFDHLDGFARTRLHRADGIRLLCRAHNQHGAEQMYGRAFMERARASSDRLPTPAEIPSG